MPDEALDTFEHGPMDYLAIGHRVLKVETQDVRRKRKRTDEGWARDVTMHEGAGRGAEETTNASARRGHRWVRWVGLVLLAVVLWRIDLGATADAFRRSRPALVVVAVLLNALLLAPRILRWRALMAAQGIRYPVGSASLAFLGGVYLGAVTPGRLGELAKALHVVRDCGVSTGRAMSAVLLDRLFDLYVLLAVGLVALSRLVEDAAGPAVLGGAAVVLVVPVGVLVHERTYGWVRATASRLGGPARRLATEGGWLDELRRGLRDVTARSLAAATALTVASYLVFFVQASLLGSAIRLGGGWQAAVAAAALGNLVALVPVSISGIGTREAVVVAYLDTVGVAAGTALGFSALLFVTFWVVGGVTGAVAWWLKPVAVWAPRRDASGGGEPRGRQR